MNTSFRNYLADLIGESCPNLGQATEIAKHIAVIQPSLNEQFFVAKTQKSWSEFNEVPLLHEHKIEEVN